MASVLTLGLISDVIRKAILVYVIRPARAASGDVPFAGLTRVACDIDNALMLAYPAALAALAVWMFLRRRPWPVAMAYLLSVAALAVAYPASRGLPLARSYMAAELATVAVSFGAFIMWFWRRESPTLAHGVALLLGLTEIATMIPYQRSPFSWLPIAQAWSIAQASYMTLYVVLIVIYGGALWGSGSSSPSSSS
ncbi:MAG: hypothetical protein QM820_26080 [Minicystis sp.]